MHMHRIIDLSQLKHTRSTMQLVEVSPCSVCSIDVTGFLDTKNDLFCPGGFKEEFEMLNKCHFFYFATTRNEICEYLDTFCTRKTLLLVSRSP